MQDSEDRSFIGPFYDRQKLVSIEDILNRNPMETLKEAFVIKHKVEMSGQQEALLQELLDGIKNETTD